MKQILYVLCTCMHNMIRNIFVMLELNEDGEILVPKCKTYFAKFSSNSSQSFIKLSPTKTLLAVPQECHEKKLTSTY